MTLNQCVIDCAACKQDIISYSLAVVYIITEDIGHFVQGTKISLN